MARKNEKGITLVEVLIYGIILVIVVGVIVQSLIGLLGLYRNAMQNRLVESSAAEALEKIDKEIRKAGEVNEGLSSFDNSPGTLTLQGIENGEVYLISFSVSDGILQMTKNSGMPVQITPSSVSVTGLLFKHLTTENSEGVKVFVEIQNNNGKNTKNFSLDNFVILRGSY